MNNGAFGEGFPYSNFHDLNMDWIIKITKDFLDQYTSIQQTITDGLEELDDKAQELEGLLQQWYDTHSEDIANELADALNDLNNWYTEHEGYLDQYVADSIASFNQQAEQKAQQTIASIPSDYTALSNHVTDLESIFGYITGVGEIAYKTWETTQGDDISNFLNFTVSASEKLYVLVTGSGIGTGLIAFAVKYEGDSSYTYLDPINPNVINIIELTNNITNMTVYRRNGNAGSIVFVAGKAQADTGLIQLINSVNARITTLLNHGITQENLSFAELRTSINIFDPDSSEMVTKDYWYYSTTIGNVVNKETNEYTVGVYSALTIPVLDGIDKVWLQQFPLGTSAGVFWYGYVDNENRLLSYARPSGAKVETTVPEGAKYLLISYQSTIDDVIHSFIATTVETVTEYPEYRTPYYVLKNCEAEYSDVNEQTATLSLPESYNLVTGDTFQLFFKGIINAVNNDNFYVKVNCSKGKYFKRLFEITPTVAETLPIRFELYDNNDNLIDEKTISLIINNKKTAPSENQVILCVGDSLTTFGEWPKELHRRLTGTGGTPAGDGLSNIQFIGTRVVDGVNYEGYGGWTFESYNTANINSNVKIITCSHDKTSAQDQHSIYMDSTGHTWKLETIESTQIKIIAVDGEGIGFPTTGVLTWVSGGTNHSPITYSASQNAPGNPFWNTNTSEVNFSWYAGNMGVSKIDYVYVLLGWNSATWSKDRIVSGAQTFIDNVHASFPNAKVILVGLEIPARDGLGANYGATGKYSDYEALMKYVHDLDDWYSELTTNNTNVLNINLSGQFDTEYNMQTWTRTVNTRNSETETYQSNGVHPAYSGYMQIADAVYRSIENLLP